MRIFLSLVAALLAGGYIGILIAEYYFINDAIQHGKGQYDPQTGEFEWNDNKPQPPKSGEKK